jgi:4-diphosphocytidyl-2-C-methyl-D-erythritol kinase
MGAALTDGDRARVRAPAKLTLSLHVDAVRPDGYHELRAEMVALDLADELVLTPGQDRLVIDYEPPAGRLRLSEGQDNLVRRALRAVGRRAGVHLTKRIPVQGGLGGGSADAAAVLRWAGSTELATAAALGADVPFCVAGGRAEVSGIGDRVVPLGFEPRTFVLLVPPFGVDTRAVFAAWDRESLGSRAAHHEVPNDLCQAALAVEPRLARWRDLLAELTGRTPALAGSGSTWFVEGDPGALGVGDRRELVLGAERGALVTARTVPADWGDPDPT